MKQFILMTIALLSIANAQAQSTAPGYYITQKNDTVITQIKIRKGAFGQTTNDFIKKVEVVDSLNNTKKFTPNDIKGYGFSHNGYKYVFVSKPTKDGSIKFLAPVYEGPNASLYQYGTYTSGNGTAFASQKVFYTFEKPDNQYLFLQNVLVKKSKKQLKEFFKDFPELQQLIDTKLRYWLEINKDIYEIMQVANKLSTKK
jgi:hypothetical protein